MAIDRDAFIGTLLPEGAVPAVAMVPPTTLGWNPDVKQYPYDPEKAKELLAEAKADGVPVDTTLYLIGRSNLFPGVTEVIEAMQQMLQDVGFNVEVQMVEVAAAGGALLQALQGRPPAADARRPARQQQGDPVFSMFFKYASEGRQSGIADPKVDEMIAKATAATGDERAEALVGALRLPARRGGAGRAALPHGELRPRRRPDRLHADDRDQLAARARRHRASSEACRRGAHARPAGILTRRSPVARRRQDRPRRADGPRRMPMPRYVSRILSSFASLVLLLVMVFFLSRLTGDPAALFLPIDATPADDRAVPRAARPQRPADRAVRPLRLGRAAPRLRRQPAPGAARRSTWCCRPSSGRSGSRSSPWRWSPSRPSSSARSPPSAPAASSTASSPSPR